MISLKTNELENDFNTVCKKISLGTTFVVMRPQEENVILLSEKRYKELEYLEKLEFSRTQSSQGKVVIKTMEELENME